MDVSSPVGMPSWDKFDKLVPSSWTQFVTTTGEFARDWERLQGKK